MGYESTGFFAGVRLVLSAGAGRDGLLSTGGTGAVPAGSQETHFDLADIMGLDVKELKCSPYAYPDKPSSTATETAELGWQAKSKEDLYIWFYACWSREPEPGESPLWAEIDILLKDSEKAASLAARLDVIVESPPFSDPGWEYNFEESTFMFCINVPADELATLDDKLDELSRLVVPFLRSVEDVRTYFVPQIKPGGASQRQRSSRPESGRSQGMPSPPATPIP
jgi:hypothetical protein